MWNDYLNFQNLYFHFYLFFYGDKICFLPEKIKEKVLESTSTPHINEKQVMGPEYWKERLNMWNRIWEETKTAGGNSSDN